VTRFTWGIIVGVLGLVALSLGLAFVAPGREPTADLSTPEGVVLAYALAVQRNDADQAWDLLARSTQTQTNKDRFASRINIVRPSYERARLDVENVRVDGDTAQADLARSGSYSRGPFGIGFDSGYTNRAAVRLIREQGNWRITSPPDPFVLDRLP
jgi:hypothetical protein